MSEQYVPGSDDPRRKPVASAIAVVAVLVLALGAFLVLSSSGDDSGTTAAAQTEQPTEPSATPSPPLEEPTQGEELPIETFEVFLSRDPFQPIRPETGGADGGAAATTTTTTTTGGATTTTTGDATTGAETTGGPGPTLGEDDEDGNGDGDGGDREQVEGREVVLIDVFVEDGEERAVVQVDGQAFEVGEGDEFADNFRVLTIDPPCVTLLFGDDAFTLCEGERVLK